MSLTLAVGFIAFWLLLIVGILAFFRGCAVTRDQQVKAAIAEFDREMAALYPRDTP